MGVERQIPDIKQPVPLSEITVHKIQGAMVDEPFYAIGTYEFVLLADHQKVIADLAAEVERLKAEKWISTKQRLPESHADILFVRRGNKVAESGWFDMAREHFVTTGHLDIDAERVTHWMPLPIPPTDQQLHPIQNPNRNQSV